MVGTVTWLNLLSGLGMLAVGLGAILYWYYTRRTRLRFFAFGALLWAVAIVPKYVMDFTVTGPFQSALVRTLPIVTALLIIALYYGLRTGLFESGFSYLIIKHTGLSKVSFDEAVALGTGFGGIEALYLGATSSLSIVILILQPGLLGSFPPEVLQQFATYLIPVPVLERLSVLFCHVFATVLVVTAVKTGNIGWLALSVAFKSVLDGALPLFKYYLGSGNEGILITAGYIAFLGIIALAGIWWLSKKYRGNQWGTQ